MLISRKYLFFSLNFHLQLFLGEGFASQRYKRDVRFCQITLKMKKKYITRMTKFFSNSKHCWVVTFLRVVYLKV